MRVVDVQEMEEVRKTETKTRFRLELEKRISDNREYNKNVFEHQETFDQLEIMDGSIIVRLLKFEGEQDNDGNLLERKFMPFETEGGKAASKVDDWEYNGVAVIVKLPSEDYIDALTNEELKYRYKRLKVGMEVWPSPQALSNGMYNFIHERNYPVQSLSGYLSLPIGTLQMIKK